MKSFLLQVLSIALFFSLTNCRVHTTSQLNKSIQSEDEGHFKAYKTTSPIIIDGKANDPIWEKVNWYSMNYKWMGESLDSLDYHGKFKLAWDTHTLYLLIEVLDDVLYPTLKDGIENYWKGDYVEVFIDEDQSGGLHQYNHQAFAYHISTEGHAIDKSTSKKTIFFDDHIKVKRSQKGHLYTWEIALKLFDNQFDEHTNPQPVEIVPQKRIGFSIAYGDNDGNHSREHFMGSKKTHGKNNDEGYINANVLGSILFLDL
ncbi:hypothetical protein UJ101_01716 [Flavobacteriaceae bacterium UJ101]|nr:hypothetical protein UJ101_01716 [Flavobacteriaceae bacterium UJ101]